MQNPPMFDHEKLHVYSKTIEFVAWAAELLDRAPKSLSVHNQLDRASTSMPLNIAEGTGKFTAPDRCRYYDSARGSAVECAACLDVFVAKKILTVTDIVPGKEMLRAIVSMLVGLIKSVAPGRVYEESPDYGTESASES